MFIVNHDYFSKEDEKKLPSFKYSATNKSPYYDYVMTHVSQWVVDNLISEKIAPNVLTTVAFCCNLLGHLILYLNCNDFENPSFPC